MGHRMVMEDHVVKLYFVTWRNVCDILVGTEPATLNGII